MSHVGFQIYDQEKNLHPCTGRQSVNHWTTKEVLMLDTFRGKAFKQNSLKKFFLNGYLIEATF